MDRSGSGFGSDGIGSRAIWSRLGTNLDQLGVGLTNLGSIGPDVDEIGIGFARIVDGIVWGNHWFSDGMFRFYVCSGDVGLYAIFGSSRRQVKRTWGHLGPTLDRLGANFFHLGAILGHSAAILART